MKERKWLFPTIVIGIIVVSVAAMICFVHYAQNKEKDVQWSMNESVIPNLSVSVDDTELGGKAVVFSTTDKPEHNVDMFVDPRCPACSQLELNAVNDITGGLVSGKIKLNIHFVTFLDEMTQSNYSKDATGAMVVLAQKGEADAAWKFYQSLWANQPSEQAPPSKVPDSKNLSHFVEQIGGSQDVVSEIYNSRGFMEAQSMDESNRKVQEEKAGGVGTPMLFIDGEMQKNPMRIDSWRDKIQ